MDRLRKIAARLGCRAQLGDVAQPDRVAIGGSSTPHSRQRGGHVDVGTSSGVAHEDDEVGQQGDEDDGDADQGVDWG